MKILSIILKHLWTTQRGHRSRVASVTDLALVSAVSGWTVTRVAVDVVFTGPSVLTGVGVTLVDVCGDHYHGDQF